MNQLNSAEHHFCLYRLHIGYYNKQNMKKTISKCLIHMAKWPAPFNNKLRSSKITGFGWSLRPIIIWFQFLGIQLDAPSESNRTKSICWWMGLTFVLINLVANMVSLCWSFDVLYAEADELSNNSSEGRKIQLLDCIEPLIQWSTNALFRIGPHLIFFIFYVNGKWNSLWLNLLEIQRDLQINEAMHNTIRRHCCYTGLALFFIVS